MKALLVAVVLTVKLICLAESSGFKTLGSYKLGTFGKQTNLLKLLNKL